jgi:preprotein translocase subunit Sss1
MVAWAVTAVVVVALVIVGAIGYVIDRSGDMSQGTNSR